MASGCNTRINAWKRTEQGVGVCDKSDPDAIRFDLHYPGMFSQQPLEFDTLYKAEQFERAVHRVFAKGKDAKEAEIRAMFGCKC